MQPLPRLLTAREVADALGVSEARVYELARMGLLPATRLGRQVRFNARAVAEWIESGGRALPGGWRREPVGGRPA